MIAVIVAVALVAPPTIQIKVSAGVVVEVVGKGSAAELAGIQSGDVLLSWRRATGLPVTPSAANDFRTPFDLREIEIRESPPGILTLQATRHGQSLQLSLRPMPWDLRVRPQLSERDLSRYATGKRLVSGKDVEGGVGVWRALASEWAKSGRQLDSAWLLSRVGDVLFDAEKASDAQKAYAEAIREAEQARRDSAMAQLWSEMGEHLWGVPERGKARDAFHQALRIREAEGPDDLAVGESLNILNRHSNVLDPAAESRARRALSIFERLAPQSYGAASALNFLGVAAGRKGDLRAEGLLHRRALTILEKLDPDSLAVAKIVSNMGTFAADGGDFAAAEALDRRALLIREKLDPGGESVAASLVNLGLLASLRNDYDLAEACYRRALTIWDRVEPGSYGSAVALQNLANVELDRDDLVKAEAYFLQALALYRKFSGERDVALIQLNLGLIAKDRGDFEGAARFGREGLETLERIAPGSLEYSDALTDLGNLAAARGDIAVSESFHERALRIRETSCPGSAKEATSLHSLGLLASNQGQLAKAADLLRRALEALELQKRRLGGSEETRSRFTATYADFYRDFIEVLIRLGQPGVAFHVGERSRAASLLSMLAERDLAFSADIPEEVERERKLADAEYERTQGEILNLSPKDNGPKIEELRGRLIELRARQQEISERIKKASPHYASLQYPQPLDLAGTRAVLDPGTLLLAYSAGKEKAFLFAVEPAGARGPGLTVFTVSGNARSLHEAVGAYRNLLDLRGPPGVDAARNLLARSRSLYDTLIKPAELLVARYDRILILPDGPLHTLPFAALARSVKNGKPEYLVDWKPIHAAVSATVYAELKKSRPDGPKSPAIQVAAFGDPRYPALVARKTAVKRGDGTEEAEEETYGDPQINAVLRGGYKFEPLPRSRQEVETIASLYAPKSEAYLGEQATEERAKSIGKDVPLIHYACHAYVNERFPLDSALVFTIPDKPKEGQDNGLLQAWEIFEKVRIDADLVTLSACESGLGKEMGGEGLIGLTRAFQYAGARSVLASLWKVEDESTGELMKRFYTYLKAGKTKDEALRLAQIDLIHSANYSQPIHWAAFQLNGDWK